MAAAGSAIGTAIAPGIGTAIGGMLGSLLDDDAGPTGSSVPSSSSAATAVYGSGLNADNWSVNFSGTQKVTATSDKPFSATGPTASTAATGGAILPGPNPASGLGGMASSIQNELSAVPMWAWAAVAALVIWRIRSRK